MKKISLIIIFCTLFTHPQVFAGDDSVEAHITRTLYIMFKLSCTNRGTASENDYRKKIILYNGMCFTAFKSNSSGWIGFFKTLSPDDLPAGMPEIIKNAYKDCLIEHVAMYFDSNADISYFAEISANSQRIFLRIQPSGEIKVLVI